MTECQEVADNMAPSAPQFESYDATFAYVRKKITNESNIIIANVALALWERQKRKGKKKMKTQMICSRCGSTDCGRDATARWDGEQWILNGEQDASWCDGCGDDDPGLIEVVWFDADLLKELIAEDTEELADHTIATWFREFRTRVKKSINEMPERKEE